MARGVKEKLILFDYRDGPRSQATAQQTLNNFTGYLQSDGYSGYNVFDKYLHVHLVGCWAHVRRAYKESLSENVNLAEYALTQIQHLYKVERVCKEANYSAQKIQQERERLCLPIIEQLRSWIEENYPKVLPKSRIGKAMQYNYSLMDRLKKYIYNGELMIDNNMAENAIRPITLSRKNFLFCGNHSAVENAAIIFTIVGCCKEQKINTREYLNDILTQMPYYLEEKKELTELLPHRWIEAHPESRMVD